MLATDDACTHEDASLSCGVLVGEIVRCPLHGATFSLRNGAPLDERPRSRYGVTRSGSRTVPSSSGEQGVSKVMSGTGMQGGTSGANGGALMRSIIQRIATGPEMSKDIPRDAARRGMRLVLDGAVDPVQAAVFLIALRMKRETDDENLGLLDAVLETTGTVTAPADDVVDLSDPYNGFNRSLPLSAFLPAVLAACGMPAVLARGGVGGAEVRRDPPPRARGGRGAGRLDVAGGVPPGSPTRAWAGRTATSPSSTRSCTRSRCCARSSSSARPSPPSR